MTELCCPKCGTAVEWSEPTGEIGAKGPAFCGHAPQASYTAHLAQNELCDWRGMVIRMPDGICLAPTPDELRRRLRKAVEALNNQDASKKGTKGGPA